MIAIGIVIENVLTFFLLQISSFEKRHRTFIQNIHAEIQKYYGEPAISLYSHHVPLVQWTTRLLPVLRDPISIPRGVLMWNRDSPVSIASLHWYPNVIDHCGLV
jgi:hypothetical protein